MSTQDLKHIHFGKAEGKVIRKVYDADHQWKSYKCAVKFPGSDRMPTFDMRFGDRRILVLDNYGNDFVHGDIEERLVGVESSNHGWLLGIDRASGEVYTVIFYLEKGQVVAVFSSFLQGGKTKVPKRYLGHLDNLKSKKRPWMITWNHQSWLDFHGRESGWSEFISAAVVSLEIFPLKDRFLELWGDSHRVVSCWK
jgi:hypothetical protein